MAHKSKKTLQLGTMSIKPLHGDKLLLTLGGKTTETTVKDLFGVTFLLADAEQQDALIPVQKTQMMVFSRKHSIMLSKDMKKGEVVNTWCEINIPQTIVEAIAEENGAKVILQEVAKPAP